MSRISTLLAVVILLCLSSSVFGAALTTLRSGDWTDTAVWSAGAVPGAGDTATITHYLTVPSGTTLAPSAITVGAAGSIIFLGTATVTGTITLNGAAANVTVNYDAVVTHNTTATTAVTVTVGEYIVYGKDLMGSASEDAADQIMYSSASGGTITAQGRSLGASRTVSSIAVASQTTGDDLVVTLNAELPVGTTHVRVTSGNLSGMIWPISATGTTATLDGALAQLYNVASTIKETNSSRDSVGVDDTAITPNEQATIGGSIIRDGGTLIGVIHKTFNGSAASRSVFFIDRTFVPISVASYTYVVTWGISAGITLDCLQMAQVWGGNDTPPTDNTVGGTDATGKNEVRYCTFAGPVTSDYAEWRWMGGTKSGGLQHAVVWTGAFPTTMTNSLVYQSATGYTITSSYAQAMTLTGCAFYNNLGAIDGSYGHFGQFTAGTGAVGTITNCVAIGTTDDFMPINSGGTLNLVGNKHVDWGYGNFTDFFDDPGLPSGSLTMVVNSSNNVGYGEGETPFNLNPYADLDAQTLISTGDQFYGCGNALGRVATIPSVSPNSHADNDANAKGALEVSGDGVTVRITGLRCEWSMWNAMVFGATTSADTVRVKDSVFANYWNYTDPAAELWTEATVQMPGAIYVSNNVGFVVVEGCQFLNPGRRGKVLTNLTAQASTPGVYIQKTSGSLYFELRGCYFNMDQSRTEGLALLSNNYWINSTDGNQASWSAGGVAHCFWDKIDRVYSTNVNPVRAVPWHHNLFIQNNAPASIAMFSVSNNGAGAGMTFNQNTFVADGPLGQFPIITSSGINARGNLFVSADDGGAAMILLNGAGVAALSSIQYNYWAIQHSAPVRNNGVDISFATLNALANCTGNGGLLSSSANALNVVSQLTGAVRLRSGVGALNIVTGFTDADGTVRDAGYMPLLTKGFGW